MLLPYLWGNGTFNPILNYTVKGIIFYQGCSNVGAPGDQYSERLSLLVKQWREQFGLGEIPFYYVQIAPYGLYDMAYQNQTISAYLREQQEKALSLVIKLKGMTGGANSWETMETDMVCRSCLSVLTTGNNNQINHF